MALVPIEGAIAAGPSRREPFTGTAVAGADTVARLIRQAAFDPLAKAIVVDALVAAKLPVPKNLTLNAKGAPINMTLAKAVAAKVVAKMLPKAPEPEAVKPAFKDAASISMSQSATGIIGGAGNERRRK